MAIKIEHDASAPTAAVELPLKQPLPDFDLEEVEAARPCPSPPWPRICAPASASSEAA
jgi:hypothetical protein